MNKAVKEKWVTALRSGKYKQGQGVLRNTADNTFCCLGVLCDLAVKEKVIRRPWRNDYDPASFYYGSSKADTNEFVYVMVEGLERFARQVSASALPAAVMEWAGLNEDPAIGAYNAIGMNDDLRLTFDEIADAIEANL